MFHINFVLLFILLIIIVSRVVFYRYYFIFHEVPERVFQRAHFGTYQRFFLDNVHCQGTESLLLQCRGNSPGVHNCDSAETAGVRCLLQPGGING